jgi:cell division cycle 2-like protein
MADDRFSTLRQRFKPLSSEGHHLLSSLLMYDPERRISANESLEHQYFKLVPLSFGVIQ